MTTDPEGDLILDSQADAELIFVHHPGFTDQSVYHLALTTAKQPDQIDDTVLAYSSQGVILVSDRDGETVYAITAPFFGPSEAYSAGPTFVGRLNTHTGVLTPVVTQHGQPTWNDVHRAVKLHVPHLITKGTPAVPFSSNRRRLNLTLRLSNAV